MAPLPYTHADHNNLQHQLARSHENPAICATSPAQISESLKLHCLELSRKMNDIAKLPLECQDYIANKKSNKQTTDGVSHKEVMQHNNAQLQRRMSCVGAYYSH